MKKFDRQMIQMVREPELDMRPEKIFKEPLVILGGTTTEKQTVYYLAHRTFEPRYYPRLTNDQIKQMEENYVYYIYGNMENPYRGWLVYAAKFLHENNQ
jgi:hypothetical protein